MISLGNVFFFRGVGGWGGVLMWRISGGGVCA